MLVKTEESDKGGKDGKADKETDGMQNPQNCMQDADNFTENADNPEQNKTEQNKANENRELPPLTPPPGEDVGVWRKYLSLSFRICLQQEYPQPGMSPTRTGRATYQRIRMIRKRY